MTIKLDKEHRAALREMLLLFLSLCGDIPLQVDQGKFKKAEVRGRQCRDCLDLLLDGGIGLTPEQSEVELTLSTEDAKRIFTWLRKEMVEFNKIEGRKPAFDEMALAATLVLATSEDVLAAIRSGRKTR